MLGALHRAPDLRSREGTDLIATMSYGVPGELQLGPAGWVREAGTVTGGGRAPEPRLLDRVRDAIRVRHYSRRTEKAYVAWVRRFVLYHGKCHPREMGKAEVSAFLTHLATELPLALERKYPRAPSELGWQWVFPATRFYTDPASGRRRRHHLHETVLQRAVREAVLRARIRKPASCHTLRHSFATICWRTATTSARSRNFSATAT